MKNTDNQKGNIDNKLYRGWMKSDLDHCLFETMKDSLIVGDILTDAFGRKWEVEIIF